MRDRSYVSYDTEIYIYYIDMPYSIDSNVVENPDGSYSLYLNSRLTYERNMEGYIHELRHIQNNDFSDVRDIHTTENKAREE